MDDDAKTKQAKAKQDYDPSPPRCATCVYWKRGPEERYLERTVRGRSGKVRTIRFKQRPHPIRNPIVDRCTFGNFKVTLSGVCNEWCSRDGERIMEFVPMRLVAE